MNLKTILLLFISIIFIQGACFAESKSARYQTHVVAKGETVFSISKKYGVSVDAIYNANPDASKGIRENQLLRVPSTNQEGYSGVFGGTTDYVLHSVQPNETLYSVSKKYNVEVGNLIDANPGLNANNFRIGTAIRVPKNPLKKAVTAAPVATGIKHTVLSKETLYSISKQYNVSMEDIANANPEIKTEGLRKNMVLNIPSTGQSTTNSVSKSSAPVNNYANNYTASSSVNEARVLKIGLLLPFLDTPENQQARFVEFYEGFLLAVEDLKAKGCLIFEKEAIRLS